MDEVQPYKNMNEMTDEELFFYMSKPYTSKHGHIIERSFNEKGDSLSNLMGEYLRKMLNKLG